MKKGLTLAFLLLLLFIISGCHSDVGPGIDGYIVSKEKDRILVVSSASRNNGSGGGGDEYHDAIWFSDAPEEVQIGQKVQIWYNFVLDSYPGQSLASKVMVLPSNKRNGSDLTDTLAIAKALNMQKTNDVPIIKRVDFDIDTDSWRITILYGDDQSDVIVEDKE
jgi:hypothetical protein